MDLQLFGRVLWRSRVIVAVGVCVAVVLAVLSAVRVDLGSRTVAYRSEVQWASYARVFVTERGFPWGKVSAASSDPARFSALAILYSNLASSDAVHKLAFGGRLQEGRIEAAPVLASQNSRDALPLISIAGISSSRARSVKLARRGTNGLITYVQRLQRGNRIAPSNRVVLQVVASPTEARVLSGRSRTLPVVVFITVLIAVCALAFLLENLRRTPGSQIATHLEVGRRHPGRPLDVPRTSTMHAITPRAPSDH